MLRHAQMERFKAQVQKECVEWALCGTEIAQELGAGFDNVGSAAEFFSVRSIRVLRIGIDKIRELSIIPVVIASINHDTAQGNGVAVNVLGRRVNDDIRPMLQGLHQERRCKSVVHKERHVEFLGKLRELFKIQNAKRRVSNRFAKDQFCIRAERLTKFCNRRFRVNESRFDTELRKSNIKQRVSSAIHRLRGHNVVTRLHQIRNSEQYGRLSRSRCDSAHTAFQLGNFAFECSNRGVTRTRVLVARLLQREKTFHFVDIFVLVSCRLENRQYAGFTNFRLPARLQALGAKIPICRICNICYNFI